MRSLLICNGRIIGNKITVIKNEKSENIITNKKSENRFYKSKVRFKKLGIRFTKSQEEMTKLPLESANKKAKS